MGRYDQSWLSRYFDDYGEKEWERWEKGPADRVKFHIHRYYLQLHVSGGDRILEIGAGAGRFTRVLAGLGARIFVTDLSSGQLELNRRHAEELGFDRAVEDRVQLDMCDMGALGNEDFDGVVCYGGPLSYVFEERNKAIDEILRVLKPSGLFILSVMSLWGSIHQYLPGVLDVPAKENAEIIRTGDLHPETYEACKHRLHMFTSQELRELLVSHGTTVISMSASNCLSAVWADRLDEIRKDSDRWAELLDMEIAASRQPGSLDLGTHLIAVAEKRRPHGSEEA
jgi:SAM-dependent methyltransferase